MSTSHTIALKFLIEEQTQIREQGVLFLKFTNRAGLNKRAGWEKRKKILNEHALLVLFYVVLSLKNVMEQAGIREQDGPKKFILQKSSVKMCEQGGIFSKKS